MTATTAGERRSAISHPLTWLALLAGIVLAAVMTFAYVGAFVDPVAELDGLPVGYVNLDQTVVVGDQEIDVGAQIMASIENPVLGVSDAVEFERYLTPGRALTAIANNEIAGVIVLPPELSQQVADIGTSFGAATQATIEVIINPGAGSIQPLVVERTADRLLGEVNATLTSTLGDTLATLDVPVDPANVASLATPVVGAARDVPSLGDGSGRGLTPLYIAVMTTLTGLIGGIAIHIATRAVSGREQVEIMGREVEIDERRVRPIRHYSDSVVLVSLLAVGGGLVIPWMAISVLGAYADQPWIAVLVCMLGIVAIAHFTLLCVTAFGVIGEILVVLITTIFGVPSSRGVYPAEALPWFFDFLGTFLPMRYLTDALRSVLFFDGRGDAGLNTAIIVLGIWALASLAVGTIVAVVVDRRDAEQRASRPAYVIV